MTKNTKWSVKGVLRVLFWLALIVVGGNGKAAGLDQPVSSGDAGVYLISCSPCAAYTVTLNGEPVGWADGVDNTCIRGYPIRYGTNRIAVTAMFPLEFQSKWPPYFTPRVQMFLLTQAVDNGPLLPEKWKHVDNFNEDWTTETNFQYQHEFVMAKQVPGREFETLGTNESAYVAQCKSLTVRLAKLIQEQDYSRLAVALGLAKPGEPNDFKAILTTNCSELVYKKLGEKETSATCVPDVSGLSAIVGIHSILIHEQPGQHLVVFFDREQVRQASKLKSNFTKHVGIDNIDCFLFGRCRGQWQVRLNSGAWMYLNLAD